MFIQHRFLKAFFALALFIVCPGPSFAGTKDGGGGKGVMCGNGLRVLDLYEAETQGLTVLPGKQDLYANVGAFGLRLFNFLNLNESQLTEQQVLEFVRQEIEPHRVFNPRGVPVPVSADATLPPMLPGCSVVQIAYAAADDRVYFDQDLWDQLDSQNQAALYLHEIIYAEARATGGAITSDESRDIVRTIFTEENPEGRYGPVARAKEHFWFFGGGGADGGEVLQGYGIDEIQDGVAGVGLYFTELKDIVEFHQTRGFLPGATLASILSGQAIDQVIDVTNKYRHITWKFSITRDPSENHFQTRAWRPGGPMPKAGYTQVKI